MTLPLVAKSEPADRARTSLSVPLVAHGLGCQLVAAWAATSWHTARVRAALLVAPHDAERDDLPPRQQTRRPIPRQPLAFPASVAAGGDDFYCASRRSEQFASDLRVARVLAAALGRLKGESGLGDGPQGIALLRSLAAPCVEAPCRARSIARVTDD